MKKIALFLLVILTSCWSKYNKSKIDFVQEIEKGLYEESYTVFSQGAFGTNLNAAYITDSLIFRRFVGTHDEAYEFMRYKVTNDSIYVSKEFQDEGRIDFNYKIFSIKSLMKENVFD